MCPKQMLIPCWNEYRDKYDALVIIAYGDTLYLQSQLVIISLKGLILCWRSLLPHTSG